MLESIEKINPTNPVKMKKHPNLSEQEFEELLNWFSANREEAGEVYERIRRGLIRYFRFKGCSDSASLADETINRVSSRLKTLEISLKTNNISIFQGFAFNVYREYLKENSKFKFYKLFDIAGDINEDEENVEDVVTENRFECLEKCLDELKEKHRNLILRYFSEQGSKKIKVRKKMTEDLNCNAQSLYARVHRIKEQLEICIENCMKNKKM